MVSVELKDGTTYKGILAEAEDTMNVQLKEVTQTAKEGACSDSSVFLREVTLSSSSCRKCSRTRLFSEGQPNARFKVKEELHSKARGRKGRAGVPKSERKNKPSAVTICWIL